MGVEAIAVDPLKGRNAIRCQGQGPDDPACLQKNPPPGMDMIHGNSCGGGIPRWGHCVAVFADRKDPWFFPREYPTSEEFAALPTWQKDELYNSLPAVCQKLIKKACDPTGLPYADATNCQMTIAEYATLFETMLITPYLENIGGRIYAIQAMQDLVRSFTEE
jgi:hypothetical protein